MKRLLLSENSLADLDSILDYIARDNPRAAVDFGEGFIKQCQLIGQHPDLGVCKGKPGTTQRMFTYRGYAIYYRHLEHCVRIQRLLHPSLDVRKQSLD